MPELRIDPLSGHRTIVAGERSRRPGGEPRCEPAEPIDPEQDPFAEGHEDRTPPELYAVRPGGGPADSPGWTVRVVPNLYPAFEGDEPFVVANRGPVFTQASAGGIHEILIFSPEHDATLGQLSQEQVELVMAALRDRLEERKREHEILGMTLELWRQRAERRFGAEDNKLGPLYAVAYERLRSGPCDLGATRAALDSYIDAVNQHRRGDTANGPDRGR